MLTTKYKITGSGIDVGSRDGAYKLADSANAGEFFHSGNTYAVTHVSGTGAYTVTLSSEMSSPTKAPDSGAYSCGLTLTASF